MSHGVELTDAQSMQANDKRYSGVSNKSNLREGSYDWSQY